MPSNVNYSATLLNQSSRYFSLVGMVLGAIVALSYLALSTLLPSSITLLLTLVISLLLTGAFHEDGLADMVDGIGGAFERSKRLNIMKDSRLGTYGACALMMGLLLKFQLWLELENILFSSSAISPSLFNHSILAFNLTPAMQFAIILIAAAASSRALAGSLIFDMPYVSDVDSSKSKPLAAQQTKSELMMLLIMGVLPLIFFNASLLLILLFGLIAFRYLFKAWLYKKLQGYTGDCLGAAQQLAELIFYVLCCAFLYQGSQ